MEDEWEEEEQLVVVELSGVINSDFLSKRQGTCKILDIDSDRPIMQVGPYVFTGKYEDALGTCVLFQEGQTSREDPESSPELKYKCHTVKKLMMQRTFLAEKKMGEDGSGGLSTPSEGMTVDAVPHSTQAPEETPSQGMTVDSVPHSTQAPEETPSEGMTVDSVPHSTQAPEETDHLKDVGEQNTEKEDTNKSVES